MQFKLTLNRDQVDECRKLSRQIAEHLQKFCSRHGSIAIEQAVLRAMGVDKPLAERIAKKIGKEISLGLAGWVGRAMIETKSNASDAAEYIAKHGLEKSKDVPWSQAQRLVREAIQPWIQHLSPLTKQRNGKLRTAAIISCKNPSEDYHTFQKTLPQVDSITVRLPKTDLGVAIPESKQFLFFKRGYPALSQFLRMTKLCQKGFQLGSCGGALPDWAVIAATVPGAVLEHDPIAAIQVWQMAPQRAIVDYHFALQLASRTGLRFHSHHGLWGHHVHSHQILAMQLVLEQWARNFGVESQSMTTVPASASDLPLTIAQAELYRELFHQSEMWLEMKPSRWVWDAGVAAFCHYWGVQVEGVNLPKDISTLGDALLPLSTEIQFGEHGQINRRVHALLDRTLREIQRIYRTGWMQVIQQDHGGLLAMSKCTEGAVFEKDKRYWNPIEEFLEKESHGGNRHHT